MSRNSRKRTYQRRRKLVGYTVDPPECCCDCRHFRGKNKSELGSPICLKHDFTVSGKGVFDTWEENNDD